MKNIRKSQSRQWTNFSSITSFAQTMARASGKSRARNLRNHPDDPDQLIDMDADRGRHAEFAGAVASDLQESIS